MRLLNAGRGRVRLVAVCVAALVSVASAAEAQDVQVSGFAGYRFGGDLFEAITATPLDIDGAPSFGAALDVFLYGGQSVTFTWSHQQARTEIPTPSGALTGARLTVDHWHVGGAQEVVVTRSVRPHYGAGLGLTRFASPLDSETRFSVGAGGGVKLMASPRVGARLDARAVMVIVDGEAATVCASGLCATQLALSVTWQLEFTAGMVVGF
jgi:hypothetical protein